MAIEKIEKNDLMLRAPLPDYGVEEKTGEQLEAFAWDEPAEEAEIDPFAYAVHLPADAIHVLKDKPLGQGAFGEVFKGDWHKRGAVALKQIDLTHAKKTFLSMSEAEIKEMMQWEVSRLSTVSHPNVVPFYGIYQSQGANYFVMEFCEGGTLQDRLAKGEVSWAKRWQWALEIAQGLAYLHEQGVLHRDLKAENILLDRNDRAKLADLGVAQVDALLQDKELKKVAKGVQDVKFIAPERYGNQVVSSKATDVYALGLVFWQLATGKIPRLIEILSLSRLNKKEVEYLQNLKLQDQSFQAIQEKLKIKKDYRFIPFDFKEVQCLKAILASIQANTAKEISEKLVEKQDVLSSIEREDWLSGTSWREPIPSDCPQALRNLILACWSHRPEDRIPLAKLVHELKQQTLIANPMNQAGVPLTVLAQLDEQLQVKRAAVLSYVPSLVTEHRLNEPVDTYLRRWELTPSTEQANWRNPPVLLANVLDRFLQQAGGGTLLLLGESGLGKTLSLYQWTDKLLDQWWRYVTDPTTHPPCPDYLPLWVRPALTTGWTHQQLKNGLTKTLTHYGFPEPPSVPLLLLIDGYDECVGDEAFTNLSQQFGLPTHTTTKWVITCRPDTVPESELMARFGYEGRLQTRYFLPFCLDQVLQYLQREVVWTKEISEQYLVALKTNQTLRSVLRNPFVLSLLVTSWEQVATQPLNTLNRWKIYEAFVRQVLHRYANLLPPAVQRQLRQPESDFVDSFNTFATRVAFQMFQDSRLTLTQVQAEQGVTSPWLKLSHLVEQYSRWNFAHRQKRLAEQPHVDQKRRALLSEADYLQIMQGRWDQFATGLPLKRKDQRYEYRHKSFFEYFLAKYIVNLVQLDGEKRFKSAVLCLKTRSLQEEPEVFRFWAEAWQEAKTPALTDTLLKVMYASREAAPLAQAASNAATLLAVVRVPFSGHDFSRIRIPQAYLSGAVMDHTVFQGADLTGVTLKACYLSHTDFRGAILQEAQFGAYPTYELEGPVRSVAYSPNGLGMAMGVGKHIFRFGATNHPETFEPLPPLKGHENWVTALAYRHDSQQLASGSADYTIRIWSPAGQCLRVLKGHTWPITGLSYTGQGVLSSSEDQTLRHWDLDTDQPSTVILRGHKFWAVAYRADGQQGASACEDHTIGLWNLPSPPTRVPLTGYLKGHDDRVLTVTYRPDGQQLASGSADRTVRLWDPMTSRCLAVLEGHTDTVCAVAYHPQGQHLASASRDHTVRIWDTASAQSLMVLQGHKKPVWTVTFRLDGRQLASGSEDHTVRLWDPVDPALVSWPEAHHHDGILTLAFSPQGDRLVSGARDHTLCVWETDTAQRIMTLKGHTAPIQVVAYLPEDATRGVSGSDDKRLRFWDLRTQSCVDKLKEKNVIRSLALSPDGQCLASAGDFTIQRWDLAANKRLPTLTGHRGIVRTLAWSPKGQQLASGAEDHTLRLWDLGSNQKELILKGHTDVVNHIAYRADGQQLASAGWDRTIRLWEVTSEHCTAVFEGHTGVVTQVAYAPDGQQLASSSLDHTIRLWDLVSRQCVSLLQGHTQGVTCVAYRPTGQKLASGSLDHAIYLWAQATHAKDTWMLTHRLTARVDLVAEHALLEGAQLSANHRVLLTQAGATQATPPPDSVMHAFTSLFSGEGRNLPGITPRSFTRAVLAEGDSSLPDETAPTSCVVC